MRTLIWKTLPLTVANRSSRNGKAVFYLLPKSIFSSIDHPSRATCANVSEQTPITRDSLTADTLGSALSCVVHVQRVILKYVMHVSPIIPELPGNPSSQGIRSLVKCKALHPSSRHSNKWQAVLSSFVHSPLEGPIIAMHTHELDMR